MGMMKYEIVMLARLITEKSLSTCLMLGVQNILATVDEIEKGFIDFGIDYNCEQFSQIKFKKEINVIDIFNTLGCITKIDALDYSDYEGANIIFDLNQHKTQTLLPELKYDLVIDGGTLEHVYNVSNAVNNVNNFVNINGFIYHMLPCAGWVNHGFYSFSPTFFIDSYCSENGFELKECKLCFKQPKGQRDRLLFSSDCRLLSDSEINRLIMDNMTSGGVLLECIAQRLENSSRRCEPNQSVYKTDLWNRKREPSDICKEKLDLVMSQYNAGVFLYGIGIWSNRIIDELIKNDLYCCIDGFFDSDISKAETIVRGKKIFYPCKGCLERAKCIIISSYTYEAEIYEMLKNEQLKCKIVKLSELV